ncbi:MAG: DUF2061 domain-containing protein [Pseudomonadota bacterium]
MDSAIRTFVKSLLWAAIGFLMMALVGLIATGSLVTGGAMAAVNTLIGLISYVVYERVWARIHWGRL